jgi:hypothetical protein
VILLPLAFAAPIHLTGPVPAGGDFFTLPFDVPPGTAEIAVSHADSGDDDVLDWGLRDPAGSLRGWGGGNPEDAIVGEAAASRSYLPGPLTPGRWEVLVGKARLGSDAPAYDVTITLRDAPTLPAADRRPYDDVDLGGGPRWLAGDLHVHARESGDASPTLSEVAAFARSRGLDFVAISEHNTTSHLTLLGPAQDASPDVLLLPGAEITTYGGHANGIGLAAPAPFTVGFDGVDVDAISAAVAEAGALLSINHPVLDLGEACIGCAWEHPIPADLAAVEIATGGWSQAGQLFTERAIAFWDALCDQGHHLAALGGSDDHSGGADDGPLHSDIGDPTTMIFADTLSRTAILDAIRAGRTVVKLQGPGDPMVILGADPAPVGDTVSAREVTFTAEVRGGDGERVRFVVDGVARDEVRVDGDPFTHVLRLTPEDAKRVRAEVWVDDHPRTVTSHLWLAEAPARRGCATGGIGGWAALGGLALRVRRPRRPVEAGG